MNFSVSPCASLAVIGSGYWGKNLVRNFAELHALRAICDNESSVLAAFSAAFPHVRTTPRFADILSDPEIKAVAIATPAETHYELGRMALLAGKDLFVEKPLTLESREGEELTALASSLNRVLMVGHLLLYHPAIETVRGLVNDGALGELYYMSSHRLNLGKVRREENVLWSFAPHDVSVMIALAGLPESVSATGGCYLQPGINDTTVTSLAFPKGIKGHIYVSWLHPFKEHKLVIIGSRRMLVLDDLEPSEKIRLYDKGIDLNDLSVLSSSGYEVIPFDSVEPLKRECEHFLSCVENRHAPVTGGQSGVDVLKVLEAATDSLKGNGTPVQVSTLPAPARTE